jgi:hypothetical protein
MWLACFAGVAFAIGGFLLGHVYLGTLIGLVLGVTVMPASSASASAPLGALIGTTAAVLVGYSQFINVMLFPAALPVLTRIPTMALSILPAAAFGAVFGAGFCITLSWISSSAASGRGFFW